MRSFTVITSSVLIATVSACSRPADPLPSAGRDDAYVGARDLALPPAGDERNPVASELEAPRPAPAREVPRPSAPRRAAAPLGAPLTAAMPAVATMAPGTDAATAPNDGGDAVTAGPGAVATAHDGAAAGASRGRGPIIIRGGAAGVDDDCALHRPPPEEPIATRPEPPTLINDRVPRRGPSQAPTRDRTRSPVPGRIGIR